MANLKDVEVFYYDRIGGMSPQQGESPQRYLKFEDVKELLKSTHNKTITKFSKSVETVIDEVRGELESPNFHWQFIVREVYDILERELRNS